MKLTSDEIARKLRTARLEKKISVEELSEKSGLSVGAISMFERRVRTNIGLDNLLSLITSLELSPSDVFGNSSLDVINQKLDTIIKQTK